MTRFATFIKATILGGLFVLIPVVLVYLIVDEMLELAVLLATPIADLFPEGSFDNLAEPAFMAILLMIGMSLLLGLLMMAGPGLALGRFIERRLLMPIPGYSVIKRLTRSIGNADEVEAFKPALLRGHDGTREIVFQIDHLR